MQWSYTWSWKNFVKELSLENDFNQNSMEKLTKFKWIEPNECSCVTKINKWTNENVGLMSRAGLISLQKLTVTFPTCTWRLHGLSGFTTSVFVTASTLTSVFFSELSVFVELSTTTTTVLLLVLLTFSLCSSATTLCAIVVLLSPLPYWKWGRTIWYATYYPPTP